MSTQRSRGKRTRTRNAAAYPKLTLIADPSSAPAAAISPAAAAAAAASTLPGAANNKRRRKSGPTAAAAPATQQQQQPQLQQPQAQSESAAVRGRAAAPLKRSASTASSASGVSAVSDASTGSRISTDSIPTAVAAPAAAAAAAAASAPGRTRSFDGKQLLVPAPSPTQASANTHAQANGSGAGSGSGSGSGNGSVSSNGSGGGSTGAVGAAAAAAAASASLRPTQPLVRNGRQPSPLKPLQLTLVPTQPQLPVPPTAPAAAAAAAAAVASAAVAVPFGPVPTAGATGASAGAVPTTAGAGANAYAAAAAAAMADDDAQWAFDPQLVRLLEQKSQSHGGAAASAPPKHLPAPTGSAAKHAHAHTAFTNLFGAPPARAPAPASASASASAAGTDVAWSSPQRTVSAEEDAMAALAAEEEQRELSRLVELEEAAAVAAAEQRALERHWKELEDGVSLEELTESHERERQRDAEAEDDRSSVTPRRRRYRPSSRVPHANAHASAAGASAHGGVGGGARETDESAAATQPLSPLQSQQPNAPGAALAAAASQHTQTQPLLLQLSGTSTVVLSGGAAPVSPPARRDVGVLVPGARALPSLVGSSAHAHAESDVATQRMASTLAPALLSHGTSTLPAAAAAAPPPSPLQSPSSAAVAAAHLYRQRRVPHVSPPPSARVSLFGATGADELSFGAGPPASLPAQQTQPQAGAAMLSPPAAAVRVQSLAPLTSPPPTASSAGARIGAAAPLLSAAVSDAAPTPPPRPVTGFVAASPSPAAPHRPAARPSPASSSPSAAAHLSVAARAAGALAVVAAAAGAASPSALPPTASAAGAASAVASPVPAAAATASATGTAAMAVAAAAAAAAAMTVGTSWDAPLVIPDSQSTTVSAASSVAGTTPQRKPPAAGARRPAAAAAAAAAVSAPAPAPVAVAGAVVIEIVDMVSMNHRSKAERGSLLDDTDAGGEAELGLGDGGDEVGTSYNGGADGYASVDGSINGSGDGGKLGRIKAFFGAFSGKQWACAGISLIVLLGLAFMIAHRPTHPSHAAGAGAAGAHDAGGAASSIGIEISSEVHHLGTDHMGHTTPEPHEPGHPDFAAHHAGGEQHVGEGEHHTGAGADDWQHQQHHETTTDHGGFVDHSGVQHHEGDLQQHHDGDVQHHEVQHDGTHAQHHVVHEPDVEAPEGFEEIEGVDAQPLPGDDMQHAAHLEEEADHHDGAAGAHQPRIVHTNAPVYRGGEYVPHYTVHDSVAVLATGGDKPAHLTHDGHEEAHGPHLAEVHMPQDADLATLSHVFADVHTDVRWFHVLRDVHVWRVHGLWDNGKGADEKGFHFTSWKPQYYDQVRHGLGIHRQWQPMSELSLLTLRATPADLEEHEAHMEHEEVHDNTPTIIAIGPARSTVEPPSDAHHDTELDAHAQRDPHTNGIVLEGGEPIVVLYTPAHWTHEHRGHYAHRVLRVVSRHELPRHPPHDAL